MNEDGQLHIAVVSTPWFPLPPDGYGGIEAMCTDLVDALVERGHRVTVIGVGTNGTKGEFLRTLDEPQGTRLGQVNPEVLHTARTALVLADLKPDIIHDHSTAGPLQAGLRGVPTVVTAHGPVTGEYGDYYRALSGTVDLVSISLAQRFAAPEIAWSGTVHHGLRVDDYRYRDRKEDFLLFLGRFARTKGVHLAIDTARAAGLPIVLAGEVNDPAEQSYFDDEIAPRLGEDVTWVGEVGFAEKIDLLSRARCLLFPICWEEPFGMVMLEAMACGTPVIALRRGSVAEVVEDGVSGFVCEDVTQLADRVCMIDRISPAACRERARTHFDATVMAAGYERLYQHLCWEVRKQQVIAPARAGAPAGIAQGVGPGCR